MLRSLLPFRMRRAQKAQSVLSAPRIEILRPRFLRIPLSPPRRTETRRRRTRLGRAAGNVILDGNGCPVPPPLSPLSSPLHNPLKTIPPLLLPTRSLFLFNGAVFTAPTLNPWLLRAPSVAEIEKFGCAPASSAAQQHHQSRAETHTPARTHTLVHFSNQRKGGKGVHFSKFAAAAAHSHIRQDYTSALHLTTGTFASHEIVLIWVFIIPPHTLTPHPILLPTAGGGEGVAH